MSELKANDIVRMVKPPFPENGIAKKYMGQLGRVISFDDAKVKSAGIIQIEYLDNYVPVESLVKPWGSYGVVYWPESCFEKI